MPSLTARWKKKDRVRKFPPETDNRQQVSVGGDVIVVAEPLKRMMRSEALAHAAWLMHLADQSKDGEASIVMLARVAERIAAQQTTPKRRH